MICRCRHCHRPKVNRPRGLCWSCYYAPGVRDQYPSESKYDPSKNATANAEEEAENDFTGEPQLDEPTQALPGTEEKIEVMARRAAHRLALFHPQDAVR